MNKNESSRRTIVVTGFGQFGQYSVNPSWEAVRHLSKTSSEKLKGLYDVDLIILEIPVAYDHVFERVPEIWEQYDPLFVIHVGVSHKAECLTFESRASSFGYTRQDVHKLCPTNDDQVCRVLNAQLDVKKLCNDLNEMRQCIACVSDDAGRYLCEYTFYQSLNIKPNQALFIHVPEIEVCPTDVVAQGLFHTICSLLSNPEYIGNIGTTKQ